MQIDLEQGKSSKSWVEMKPKRFNAFKNGLVAASVAALMYATASVAQMPPPEGPEVFGGYTQNQLDAAYDQNFWDNDPPDTGARATARRAEILERYGAPQRWQYGPSSYEGLDVYNSDAEGNRPIMIFIHGGAWRGGSASSSAQMAEMYIEAGATFVALDFVNTLQNGGNLMEMAEQVRRGIAWVYKNAPRIKGNRNRIFIAGHSSGGHLCGVAMTTDWEEVGLPTDIIKGGLCSSGMYELYPVSLSARRLYVNFTPEAIEELSPLRHLNLLNAPMVVAHAGKDTPEFQRQSVDFFAAAQLAGKTVKYINGIGYNHFETGDAFANPYAYLGRAGLELMRLEPNRGDKTPGTRKWPWGFE